MGLLRRRTANNALLFDDQFFPVVGVSTASRRTFWIFIAYVVLNHDGCLYKHNFYLHISGSVLCAHLTLS